MLKYNVRPKYGLTLSILSEFMSKDEIKNLVDRYMFAKKQLHLRQLASQKRPNIEAKIEMLLDILEPCLKKTSGYYHTTWGRKNRLGLRETIKENLFI